MHARFALTWPITRHLSSLAQNAPKFGPRQGPPLFGIGCGSISQGMRGEFRRWCLGAGNDTVIHSVVPANQFSVRVKRPMVAATAAAAAGTAAASGTAASGASSPALKLPKMVPISTPAQDQEQGQRKGQAQSPSLSFTGATVLSAFGPTRRARTLRSLSRYSGVGASSGSLGAFEEDGGAAAMATATDKDYPRLGTESAPPPRVHGSGSTGKASCAAAQKGA